MILVQPCRQMLERNGASFGSSRWCFRFAWARNRHDGLPSSEARKCAGCKRYDSRRYGKRVSADMPSKRDLVDPAEHWNTRFGEGFRGIGGTLLNRSGNEAESQRER